ncbi:MAG TPA: G8 domain-containing protein, partial [Gemmataceae bacterium]|nr:G8 domain-containing protein [Gemmataceae bacterium]
MGILSRFLRRGAQSNSPKARRRQRYPFRPLVEPLEIRLTPHANVVLDAEHLAVFGKPEADGSITGGLVPDVALTYKSMASGPWSASTTWQYLGSDPTASPIPGPGANVLVSANTTVTVDTATAAVRTVRDDGVLNFDPSQDTALKVDTLIVEPQGTFQVTMQ